MGLIRLIRKVYLDFKLQRAYEAMHGLRKIPFTEVVSDSVYGNNWLPGVRRRPCVRDTVGVSFRNPLHVLLQWVTSSKYVKDSV